MEHGTLPTWPLHASPATVFRDGDSGERQLQFDDLCADRHRDGQRLHERPYDLDVAGTAATGWDRSPE